jgi:hypothetical protein
LFPIKENVRYPERLTSFERSTITSSKRFVPAYTVMFPYDLLVEENSIVNYKSSA